MKERGAGIQRHPLLLVILSAEIAFVYESNPGVEGPLPSDLRCQFEVLGILDAARLRKRS